MPKPLVFVACEKVITDTAGLVSLITIVEKMLVNIPAGIDIPKNTAIPMQWNIVSIWQKDDAGSQYEQMIRLVGADGTIAMHTEPTAIEWQKASMGAKNISHLTAVPITDGSLELQLFYRKIGEQDWTEAATYPVFVELTRQ
jgi:hypothetical protein